MNAPVQSERYERLDALRGIAMIWMTIFHFFFNLSHFGFMNQDFYSDPFWTLQRVCIVSLFLFCAASGQALALSEGIGWSRFFSRWKKIFAASILVSIGTYFAEPKTFVYFGILHGIAAMLLILRVTAGWSKILWLPGIFVVSLKWIAAPVHNALPALEILNQPQFNWIGFISSLPVTEDYVPLIPWLGVVWIAFSIAQWIIRNRKSWFDGELNSNLRFLASLGRWSLIYYLIHQPVLFGLVMLAKYLAG
jgi:uncharacterized membrane protein